jgi:hypothetical protein
MRYSVSELFSRALDRLTGACDAGSPGGEMAISNELNLLYVSMDTPASRSL